jgi:GntP family gluconate:H+ symporter
LLSLEIILLAILKFDIHPFLALFIGAIGFGICVGMPTDLILKSVKDGFGGVLGNIGPLFLLGVTIGTFLEKTGGAMVLAQKVLSWIGEKSIMLAMMLSG